ncbi:MAG: phosphocholine cytidylyltransferase family protein [Treponema sp.]|jgi:CTP:phosphocholine cytidylyltransferase-like protein|nr:phosphocholine cytidylyltransferase family protein [Treponema sp.]
MLSLTRSQFDLLVFLKEEKDGMRQTQRDISRATGLPADIVDKTLAFLNGNNLIGNGALTASGLDALEPYRVKRAVFIAAGFGSRLVPITLNTPKPLIRVKGIRIIDTLLDAVIAAGIKEIIIVRGYLSEQFDQLKYKYPSIQFMENPFYNEANNISSMMIARSLLQNAYVLESDLMLSNPGLICKYHYSSNYLGVPVKHTDDWCFETNNGIITKVKIGGQNCHQMFGISYWNQNDGAKLAEHIKQAYEMPEGKKLYWDEVPLKYYINDYTIEVRECAFNDIIEIDTFSELKKLDEAYCA